MKSHATTVLLFASLAGSITAQGHADGAPCSVNTALMSFGGDFDCMWVPVYENREKESGRELEIHVVVLPATGNDVAEDPVFFLPGGPGQSSADLAGFLSSFFAKIRRERDLVLVDYRGTGESNGLDFEMSNEDIMRTMSDPFPRAIVERELARLRERADLTQYTTDAIVDDLNDVREFLGYDQINLWGGSYGTRVALVFLRRHPEAIRTAVIKAVAPLGFAIGAEFATDAQKSLDRTIAACAADPDCSKAYGDVSAQLDKLLARFEDGPIIVPATHPVDGSKVDISLTADTIALAIRQLLYASPAHGLLPGMIARGAEGDLQEWADNALASAIQGYGQMSIGMFMSVTGAEDAPLLRKIDLEERARGTFLNARFASSLLNAYEGWPCATIDPSFWEPVRSDVPVLVVSGALDPVTPPNQGAEAARHLSNSLHLVFETGSHDDSMFRPCIDDIYADFYRAGTLEGLDTGCASIVRPIRFSVDE